MPGLWRENRLIAPLQEPLAAGSPALRWAELAESLGRCERRLREDLAQQALPTGLSQAHFSLLWACCQAPPQGLSQNELAAALALSPAHVSGQVEQLRARGLLAGHRRAPDRRKQVWQLTVQGESQLESALAALIDWAGQLDDRFQPEQRVALISLLGELALALEQEAQR
jgi:DNA-binding MarR family transcriptional regulator